jgi:hypothetical protein
MGIRKGGSKRISPTTWMGHEVGRRSDRHSPFQDQVVEEEVTRNFLEIM